MYVTINDIDGNRVAGPVRVCEGQWLIPYKAHNYRNSGNFTVLESTKQYPLFSIFDTTCELRYYTLAEINAGVSFDE